MAATKIVQRRPSFDPVCDDVYPATLIVEGRCLTDFVAGISGGRHAVSEFYFHYGQIIVKTLTFKS